MLFLGLSIETISTFLYNILFFFQSSLEAINYTRNTPSPVRIFNFLISLCNPTNSVFGFWFLAFGFERAIDCSCALEFE